MTHSRVDSSAPPRTPVAVLLATFLFNLGQGVLRPSLPLYLQQVFAANYRMVTLIPVVFGAGRWITSLPSGFLLDRVGRKPLMIAGLSIIACIDLASTVAPAYGVFLALRGVGGVGWAMFGTVATTTVVAQPGARRGRALSLLLMSETLGLLVGSTIGGLLYERVGIATPFVFEAACMGVAAMVVGWQAAGAAVRRSPPRLPWSGRGQLRAVLEIPRVVLMSVTAACLVAIQTGILVFLYPLHLVEHGQLEPGTVGYFVSLTVLGRLLALGVGGGMSDRWGRVVVIVPALGLYGAVLATVTLPRQPVLLGLWSFLIGAAAGFVAPIPTAIIGDQVPPPLQGIAIGWLRMLTDTGMIVGPLVFGTLADATHLAAPFIVGGGLLGLIAWQCRRSAKIDPNVAGVA